MLEKFENNFDKMYPISPDNYWRVMRQHIFKLDELAIDYVFDTGKFKTAPTKYNYYRLFLEIELDRRYWIPILVLNRVESIYDELNYNKPFKVLSDFNFIEEVISTVHE